MKVFDGVDKDSGFGSSPDMRKVAEGLWSRMERKYRIKLKQQDARRRTELRRKAAEIEQKYQLALQRKQQEVAGLRCDEFR